MSPPPYIGVLITPGCPAHGSFSVCSTVLLQPAPGQVILLWQEMQAWKFLQVSNKVDIGFPKSRKRFRCFILFILFIQPMKVLVLVASTVKQCSRADVQMVDG